MTQLPDLGTLAGELEACGLQRTPPIVLLTRWQALLASEKPLFLDAADYADKNVPGTRYTFVALTNTAICYLHAEHDDEFWVHDPNRRNTPAAHAEPRAVKAWRRPLTAISEIQLSGNAFDWLPADEPAETVTPGYVLAIGQDMVEVPLPSPWRRGQPPDARPVIDLLVARWRSTQS